MRLNFIFIVSVLTSKTREKLKKNVSKFVDDFDIVHCPSEDCWTYDEDTKQCSLKTNNPCWSLTCNYNQIRIEFESRLFGTEDDESPSPFRGDTEPVWDETLAKWVVVCRIGECGMTAHAVWP